jgi:tight adherence protein C
MQNHADILLPLSIFLFLAPLVWMVGRFLLRDRGRGDDDPLRRRPVFGPVTNVFASLLPLSAEARKTLERELRQAGHYAPHALTDYLAIRNVSLFAWCILIAFAVFAAYDPQRDPTIPVLIAGAVGGILLFGLPRMILQAQARRRVAAIQTGLPDGLDMLNMCMTGGLSLQMALERVGGEIRTAHQDLATEFDIIRRHSETHTMERALEMFAERIDTPEVKSLAAVTSQSVRLGSNVGTALQEYADSLRLGQRQRAEERGNRRSVAMLFPVALCLAPPVYILLLAPAALELRDFVMRENRPGGVLSQNTTVLQQPYVTMDQIRDSMTTTREQMLELRSQPERGRAATSQTPANP